MEFITALDHSSLLLWLPPYHPQVQDVSMGSSDFLSDTQVDPRMVEQWIGNPIYLTCSLEKGLCWVLGSCTKQEIVPLVAAESSAEK